VLPDRAPGDPGLVSPPGRAEVRQLGGSPVADQAKAADIRQLGSNWRATTRLGATPGSATRARAEERYRPRSHLEPFKKFARTLRKHWRELLGWFAARGLFAPAAPPRHSTRARITTRNAHGFRSYEHAEIALYHALGALPVTLVIVMGKPPHQNISQIRRRRAIPFEATAGHLVRRAPLGTLPLETAPEG
jgi:hypothetical protein